MKLRTQFLLGYVVVLAIMILVAGYMYLNVTAVIDTQHWIAHSQEVMTKAELIQRLARHIQSAKRGFQLTGEEALLQPYDEAIEEYQREISSLEELVSNDPRQVDRLEEIEAMMSRYQNTVVLRDIEQRRRVTEGTLSMQAVIESVKSRIGESIIDQLGEKLNVFAEVERNTLAEREKQAEKAELRSVYVLVFGTLLAVAVGIAVMLVSLRTIVRQVGGEPAAIREIADEIASGNLDMDLGGELEKSTGIRASIGAMLLSLRENRKQTDSQDWLKMGIVRLSELMRGDPKVEALASNVIAEMATYLEAQVGAFYLMADKGSEPALSLLGSYAYQKRKNLSNRFSLGEGLVGQAALEKQQILVRNVPEDYVKVTSGLGERSPRFICVIPFLYEDRVKGVIEVGTLNEMTDLQLEYLAQAMPALAIAVQSAQSRTELAGSLEESQKLSEELQAQQEELKAANEELEEQTQRLKQSEERLKAQQEELQVTNEELEEKNDLLERQKREMDKAQRTVTEKAEELALASKYKSEFLANMSHELRTPLNSLLLLARAFTDNKEGNLTEEQVESAGVIYKSGNELLSLISEILDLSKIEAGRMELRFAEVAVAEMAEATRKAFQHLAAEKGLKLEVRVEDEAPEHIISDRQRVEQVIKNIVSNAVKFTEKGSVSVAFGRPAPGVGLERSGLDPGRTMAIAVVDTGTGIAAGHQKIIFEAFQQVDGSAARKYGGTGLGLSISRELVRLLGGEIKLASEPGRGSTFTIYLPQDALQDLQASSSPYLHKPLVERAAEPVDRNPAAKSVSIPDDRETIEEGDRSILIIDDDLQFTELLARQCRDKGFKCLAAASGEIGLDLARRYLPQGILLDIKLPGMDGWQVLEHLKDSPSTRHIPVHVVSVEEPSTESLRKGAVGHLQKPVSWDQIDNAIKRMQETSSRKVKSVRVVEDNRDVRRGIVKLIAEEKVRVKEASSAKEATKALKSQRYDCMILDLGLRDMDGDTLLKTLQQDETVELPPIIIYTARDLTPEEEMKLRSYSDSIIIKSACSEERLLDEVTLFLHRVVAEMPASKRQVITSLYDSDALLREKKVLIVDDDMRTVFALSKLLSERGMKTLKAENGEKAVKLLAEQPEVDLVLMDIMMPGLDGYEAIKRIRAQDRFKQLPIIALTAKAMKGDQERCMEAGASDYLTKPVDQDRLISMMRVWLYR